MIPPEIRALAQVVIDSEQKANSAIEEYKSTGDEDKRNVFFAHARSRYVFEIAAVAWVLREVRKGAGNE